MAKIDDYAPIAGQTTIDEIKLIAERLKGKIVQQVKILCILEVLLVLKEHGVQI